MKKNKIEKNKFNDKSCFLCGINLNKKNRTKEHVIPTWLQKRYNFMGSKINSPQWYRNSLSLFNNSMLFNM